MWIDTRFKVNWHFLWTCERLSIGVCVFGLLFWLSERIRLVFWLISYISAGDFMFSLSFSVQSFLEFCKFRLFVYRFRKCLGWLLGRVWSLSFIIWSLLGSIFIEVLACHDAVVIWFIFVIVTVEIIAISLLHVVHVFDATTSQCLLLSLIWVEFLQLRLERSQLLLQTQLSFKLGNLVSVPLPHSLSKVFIKLFFCFLVPTKNVIIIIVRAFVFFL